MSDTFIGDRAQEYLDNGGPGVGGTFGMPSNLIIDQWSEWSKYIAVGDNIRPGRFIAPMWCPFEDRRRLAVYKMAASLMANVFRRWLWTDEASQKAHREYGDALLLVDRIMAGVLGETFGPVVTGANIDIPPMPDLPEMPDPLTDEQLADPVVGPIMRRIFDERVTRWTADATQIVDAWVAEMEAHPALLTRQTEIDDWFDTNGIAALMVEAERTCIGLGDTVYVLVPQPGGWPLVKVFDPGFYFPVLAETDQEYPDKVHLCWEFERPHPDGNGSLQRWVHRLTWELVDIKTLRVVTDGKQAGQWADGNGDPASSPAEFLGVNEVVDQDGNVWRTHPWETDTAGQLIIDKGAPIVTNPANQSTGRPHATTQTCVFSDMAWNLSEVEGRVDVFDVANAEVVANRVDLGIDFLPVVHVPNTPASLTHFGSSSLGAVVQILEDMGQLDSDIVTAEHMAAVPIVAFSGVNPGQEIVARAGLTLGLGPDGKVSMLDMGLILPNLYKGLDRKQDRISQNGRVPASLMGRVTSEKAASGIALLIDAEPFTQLVGILRMVRDLKYRLLLKFAQRMAQVQQALPPGPTPDVFMQFGSYLPMDKGLVATQVAAMLAAHAISTLTGVQMLMAAGFNIDDATKEVERIQHENWEAAEGVSAATGSRQLAADALGLTLPPQQFVPVPKTTFEEVDADDPNAPPVPTGGLPPAILPAPTPGGRQP